MACRISELVLKCHDPEVLARFWCEVLDFIELTRKLGPRWARGSEPWPARWRGCGVALVVRRGGPGCRVGGGSGTRGQGLWLGARGSGGLQRAGGDGDSSS